MEVVITNLAWIKLIYLDQISLYILKNDLTIIPKAMSSFDPNPAPIRLFAETDKWLGIPRAYYLKKKRELSCFRNVTEKWQISEGQPLSDTETLITLRPEDQVPAMEAMVEGLRRNYYGMLEAWTSFGKSYTAVEIIKRINCNCLMLMHRESLIDQWTRDLKNVWPKLKIGHIQGKKCDYKDKDLVFATMQSLMGEHGDKYPDDMWKYFGMVCIDECHTVSARKFSTVLPKFTARYLCGISGTVRRLDGTEKVFNHILGDIIHKASDENRINPVIYARNTNCEFRVSQSWDKPQLISLISASNKRNNLIANDIYKAVKAGRNPLVVSERKEILEKVSFLVSEISRSNNEEIVQDYYIGGRTEDELVKASEAQVIYATLQMVKEGINIPRLCTLIMCTPCSDNEQLCVVENELVWINKIPKLIQDVKEGDFATLPRRGEREVLKTYKRKFTGKVYTVKPNRLIPFTLTGNHKVLVKKSFRYKVGDEDSVKLSDSPSKYLAVEKLFKIINSEKYKIEEKAKSERYCVGVPVVQGKTQHLLLNKNRCRLLGYFLAEGSIVYSTRVNKRNKEETERNKRVKCGCKIAFSFNINEINYHKDVVDIIKEEFDLDCFFSIDEEKHTLAVCCSSVDLGRFIKKFIKGKQPVRKMSQSLMTLRVDWQKIIFETAFYGDGSIGDDGQTRYHTSSPYLAAQFQQIFFRSGLVSSIFVSTHKEGTRFSTNNSYEVYYHPNSKNLGWFDERKMMVWFPISKIECSDYDGFVYNLGIDTYNFYSLMGGTVHNCGRIVRRYPNKKEPMVVDYVDCCIPKFKGSFLTRYKLYKKLGWKVLGLEKLEL